MRRVRAWVLAVVGLAAGIALALWALGRIDTEAACALMASALPLLPVALAIEAMRIGAEALAARSLFRAMNVPITPTALARAHLVAYSVLNSMPMGRVAAEVTKATVLSSQAPLANTSAVATISQALNLIGSACILVPCIVAARAAHASFGLAATLLGQCAVLGATGLVLLAFAYFVPVRWRLLARVPRIAAGLEQFRAAMRALPSFPWAALGFIVVNRLLQVGLLALLVHAVGAEFSLARPFVAIAVLITGASALDFVPGQVGALEGAFTMFASAMQLSATAALALALLVHAIQFSWILVGAAMMLAGRRRSVPTTMKSQAPVSAMSLIVDRS
jgi:uncharacterized membrane protein YbhN (UPF0104 family)